MKKIWKPVLPKSGSLYERLLAALEKDIQSGILAPGAKLPPQRQLAHHLGIGLGTVTKVYGEAERRGLLSAHIGRGSYVSDGQGNGAFSLSATSTDGTLDLARNFPPLGPARQKWAETLTKLSRRPDLLATVGYASQDGPLAHRVLAAQWLQRRHGLHAVHADQIVLCTGGQQAIALSLSVLCRAGDVILCEAASFHGFKAVAEQQGLRLKGVGMDSEGIIPEALDQLAQSSGARVLYTIPTLQNPTGSVMGEGRRRVLLRVAEARNLTLLEDDVYGAYMYGKSAPTPLINLAPDRVWYIGGVSKILAPGLRVGFLIPPNQHQHDQVLRAVRANHYAPPALNSLILSQWIEDGTADDIADALIGEAAQRNARARALLNLPLAPYQSSTSLHLWLPMNELAAERAAGRALRAGVEVTPPAAPIVDPDQVCGLRLCLGAAPDKASLERAIQIFADAISATGNEASALV